MRTRLITALLLFQHVSANGGERIAFASMYGDHMVLQRAPDSAVVWGFCSKGSVTSFVEVFAEGGKQRLSARAELSEFNATSMIWKASLPPITDTFSSFTITATTDRNLSANLIDVLFGDVFVCSGQSNMAFLLENAFGGHELVQDANRHPNIRLFTTKKLRSDRPLTELGESTVSNESWQNGTELRWSRASNISVSQSNALEVGDDDWLYMSAVCYLYGKELHEWLNVPVGLISTNWGGTRIEAWSSAEVLKECDQPVSNTDLYFTELYNAMVRPLQNTTIRGVIWYQGESNTGDSAAYACLLPSMANAWRRAWVEGSNTSPNLTFGVVQLAGNVGQKSPLALPYFRWAAQTQGTGSLPSKAMPLGYLATAIDLNDAASPYGAVHSRYKKEIAYRLALSARRAIYKWDGHVHPVVVGDDVTGTISGQTYTVRVPFVDTGVEGLELTLPMNISTAMNMTNWDDATPFEVCIVEDGANATDCDEQSLFDSWRAPVKTVLDSTDGSTIILEGKSDSVPLAVRYAWRAYPCEYEGCGLRSALERIPPAPFHAWVTSNFTTRGLMG